MEPERGKDVGSQEDSSGNSSGHSPEQGKEAAGTPGSLSPEKPEEKGPDVLEATDLTWEGIVEKGKIPVAVMFYSPSCAFCHQMDPYFREFAGNFRGLVLFVRLNILTSTWIPERYGVRSTPTFKFFCDGKPVQELVGAVYPAILKRAISDVLAHGKECAKNSTAVDYEITGYG